MRREIAAEVLLTFDKPASQLADFMDKAKHLVAIHKAPPECIPASHDPAGWIRKI